MGPCTPWLAALVLCAIPSSDPSSTATQDESPSREAIQRRLRAIASDLDGASEFRDTVRQSARILCRTELQLQMLFLAPGADSEKAFRDNLATIQKNTSLVHFKLQSLLDDLGVVAAARDKEDRRWQAYHDYVCARLCIEIDAAYSYNALLGLMRKEFLPQADTVGWRLVLSKETNLDLERTGMRQRARTYLRRLIDENPGTAWEYLARQELQELALRWKWETISR
jgi:hypothetical protein